MLPPTMKPQRLPVCLLLATLFVSACSSGGGGAQTKAQKPAAGTQPGVRTEKTIRVGDQRQVSASALSPMEKAEIQRAWQQFVTNSPLWRVSLRSLSKRKTAAPYVLSEYLFRHFFTASLHSRKDEIDRVARSVRVIGEPAAAYFAKPLVADLVPLGKAVVVEVPDPKDPSARIKKTFHHFQIDDFTRRDAARVLVAIGPGAVSTLSSPALLRDARPSGRRYAAFALGRIATDEAVDALGRHLAQAPDWQDRAAAAEALGAALEKNERARPLLEGASKDSDPFVRKKAGEALAGRVKIPF